MLHNEIASWLNGDIADETCEVVGAQNDVIEEMNISV